ncbi:MAG: GtrA family protein [Sphingomonadales bacterium]|nr:GtrA family protein [Sphingomonadales bacterium]MDE2567888.1 GtrA family protein [Sphingomonadales bacterium]
MSEVLVPFLQRMRQVTVLRYLIASAGALAVDMGTFLSLMTSGMPAVAASSVGYGMGIVAHWILSSRKVFADQVAERGPARTRQKAMFVVSALIGLALTTAIVWSATMTGFDPRAAKLAAVVASFTVTWMLRKAVVFR